MKKKTNTKVVRKGKRPNKTSSPSNRGNEMFGFKKRFLKSRPVCKVTFTLPKEAALEAHFVTIVGEFNNWDKESTPMKKMKNGNFTVTVELEPGRDYSFRYLIDGNKWANDWYADRYVPNPFGGDDSVVSIN